LSGGGLYVRVTWQAKDLHHALPRPDHTRTHTHRHTHTTLFAYHWIILQDVRTIVLL
jgi:hypothetical protein